MIYVFSVYVIQEVFLLVWGLDLITQWCFDKLLLFQEQSNIMVILFCHIFKDSDSTVHRRILGYTLLLESSTGCIISGYGNFLKVE